MRSNKTFRISNAAAAALALSDFESSSSDGEDAKFKLEREALVKSFQKGMMSLLKEKGLIKLTQAATIGEMSQSEFSGERADSMTSLLSDDHVNIRTVHVGRTNSKQKKCLCLSWLTAAYRDNQITTSKYNVLTFFPLNLMLQFSKFANLYFLILTAMEMFPLISDSGGVPVLLLPLSFVVGISMIKDIYEDYLRHKSDNEENNRKV